MAMNPLPPQAYTKETLLRAYAWVQNQSNSIKEMASTPDILVSLYLKATRDGDSALDRPSIQNFKSELKSLADLMGGLEKNRPAVAPVARAPKVDSMPQASYEEPPTVTKEAPTHFAPSSKELDPLSLEMIQEIQGAFNLSHHNEALRLLIKLGYLKARKILTE